MTSLKLIERNVPKEKIAMLSIPMIPVKIIITIFLTRRVLKFLLINPSFLTRRLLLSTKFFQPRFKVYKTKQFRQSVHTADEVPQTI